jgi:hypothetical protein
MGAIPYQHPNIAIKLDEVVKDIHKKPEMAMIGSIALGLHIDLLPVAGVSQHDSLEALSLWGQTRAQ